VRQLVEVRLKIQEKRDDDGSPKATVRLVLGHHMQLQENYLSNIKLQCDRCCASIWTMIHSWYKCKGVFLKSTQNYETLALLNFFLQPFQLKNLFNMNYLRSFLTKYNYFFRL
jgi:hypothetical protein